MACLTHPAGFAGTPLFRGDHNPHGRARHAAPLRPAPLMAEGNLCPPNSWFNPRLKLPRWNPLYQEGKQGCVSIFRWIERRSKKIINRAKRKCIISPGWSQKIKWYKEDWIKGRKRLVIEFTGVMTCRQQIHRSSRKTSGLNCIKNRGWWCWRLREVGL